MECVRECKFVRERERFIYERERESERGSVGMKRRSVGSNEEISMAFPECVGSERLTLVLGHG